MGIFGNFKKKFGKKPKVYTPDEIAGLCIDYVNEVKLLSHAVDVTKPEDRAFFASRTEKFIENYVNIKKDIERSREFAEKNVQDFIDNGDDILAHESQESYDSAYAEWKAEPILLQIAESKLDASYTALCALKDYFEGKSQNYEPTLVEKISKDTATVETMQNQALAIATDEVAAMDPYNPFALSPNILSIIGKAASIFTMGMGIAENNPSKTITGAALYHLNNQADKHDDERQP